MHVAAITPDNDETTEALQDWLLRVVTAGLPPRDFFGELGLC